MVRSFPCSAASIASAARSLDARSLVRAAVKRSSATCGNGGRGAHLVQQG